MFKNITDSKYEYNVRMVEELSSTIVDKEKELENTKGFLNSFKAKSELRKLYRLINSHGKEILDYEYLKANNY